MRNLRVAPASVSRSQSPEMWCVTPAIWLKGDWPSCWWCQQVTIESALRDTSFESWTLRTLVCATQKKHIWLSVSAGAENCSQMTFRYVFPNSSCLASAAPASWTPAGSLEAVPYPRLLSSPDSLLFLPLKCIHSPFCWLLCSSCSPLVSDQVQDSRSSTLLSYQYPAKYREWWHPGRLLSPTEDRRPLPKHIPLITRGQLRVCVISLSLSLQLGK